jgi:cell wall-associated NlpC family hydrolase
MAKLKKLAPRGTAVAPLVTQVIMGTVTVTSGAAGAVGDTTGQGPGLTAAQTVRFLAAAESRLGMPYVWGGAGPRTFDCSGLVQWSMRQAGILMPRVAADQARTGPLIKLSGCALTCSSTTDRRRSYISRGHLHRKRRALRAPEPGRRRGRTRRLRAGFAGAVGYRASPPPSARQSGRLTVGR